MTDRHIEIYGLVHEQTTTHLLTVVEMFRNWSRETDAVIYLERVLLAIENGPFSRDPPAHGMQAYKTFPWLKIHHRAQVVRNPISRFLSTDLASQP